MIELYLLEVDGLILDLPVLGDVHDGLTVAEEQWPRHKQQLDGWIAKVLLLLHNVFAAGGRVCVPTGRPMVLKKGTVLAHVGWDISTPVPQIQRRQVFRRIQNQASCTVFGGATGGGVGRGRGRCRSCFL